MTLTPVFGFLGFSCLIITIITAALSFETFDGKTVYTPTLKPIVPAIFLFLTIMFTTAAIFFGTNPQILQ